MATDPAYEALLAKVQKDFPSLMPFLKMPGIEAILVEGARDGLTADVMANRVYATDYWKGTTSNQRAWDSLKATDPAGANRQFQLTVENIAKIGTRLGVTIPDIHYGNVISDALRNGWDDDQIKTVMLGISAYGGYKNVTGGDLGRGVTQIRSAMANFGVSMSDFQVYQYARGVLDESQTQNGVDEYIRSAAISRYARNKPLVTALQNGLTTKAYADPYVQLAAQELSINPETIDLQDSKWSRFLEESPNPNEQGMTLDQWRQTIRSQDVYGWDQTRGAKDEAVGLATQFAKMFGATG